jgi:hypothetical protein
MSTSGGPKLSGRGRGASGKILLALDAGVLASFAGAPTTNQSAVYDLTLGQAYDWANSGSFTRTNNVSDVSKPKGYEKANIYICRGVITAVGSLHFGMGRCAVSASTRYVVTVWYRQSKQGLGGPYIRGIVGNTSLGSLVWGGYDGKQSISGSANWPANEWIRLFQYGSATAANETGLYISNYFGNTVGDTIWCFGPQFEARDSMTPLILNGTGAIAATSRGTTDGWKDLGLGGDDGDLIGGITTTQRTSKVGFNIFPADHGFLDFDGTDDYVQVPHSSPLMLARTWSCWFYLDSIPASSTYDSIFQKDENWNTAGGTMLSMIYGNLRFGWGTNWAADCTIPLSGNITTGRWYHFTGTSTGDTTSGGVKMYLDGVFRDAGTAADVPTSTQVLKIGSGDGGPMNGRIAKFTVYSTELTAQEVKENFNQERSRFGV